jgi:hypothetical protein
MPPVTEKVCEDPSCRSTFVALRSDARYCSPACRQHAYRQRSSARPRPVDEIVAELARIVDEMEAHGLGDDEERDGPRRRKALEAMEFSDESIRAIRDRLMARLDVIAERLTDESMRRHHWAAMAAMARDDQEAMERHLAAWHAVSANFDDED